MTGIMNNSKGMSFPQAEKSSREMGRAVNLLYGIIQ